MFLRQGDETGAVGGEVFLHEAELDVLEVAFGEQAPGEAVEPTPGQMVHELLQCVGKEEFLKQRAVSGLRTIQLGKAAEL